MEEERNKERCNVLYELLGTLSMASLIYSLYCHHGYCIIGVFVATSISIFDVFKLYEMIIPKPKVLRKHCINVKFCNYTKFKYNT